MPDSQVQNFVSRMRGHAEEMDAIVQAFRSDVQQWQKLGYNAAIVDENITGDNEDVDGVQIDYAVAGMVSFITTWDGVAGTYLLEIER